MVEGLDDGRWALLSKSTTAWSTASAATDLMSVMFDDDGAPAAAPAPWTPRPGRRASSCWRAAPPARARPRDASLRAALRARSELLRGAASTAGAGRRRAGPAARDVVADRPDRAAPGVELGEGALADVKAVRTALGGTINDVVLTIITGGLRDLLEARGETIAPNRVVRTMVPVSVRRPASAATTTTASRGVRAAAGGDRRPGRPAGGHPASRWTGSSRQAGGRRRHARPAVGVRAAAAARARQPGHDPVAAPDMDTAATNVPGPQRPVHALGRRLAQSYP